MSLKPLIAGNWKMNGLKASASELLAMIDLAGSDGGALSRKADLLICPPTTLLMGFVKMSEASAIDIGAQDCHPASSGAHTGDISAEMVADAGATAIIVGHSERRTDHSETDALVRAKVEAVMRAGLRAILCIGETGAQKDAGITLNVVETQLSGSIPDSVDPTRLVVAYEPVWAIGTGRTPTTSDVAEVHAAIRRVLVSRFGAEAGASVRILYGGSVKPGNAAELLSVPDVNGALVGGASLKAADFIGIAQAAPARD